MSSRRTKQIRNQDNANVNEKWRSYSAIVVAIIGLLGTIVAAYLSFLSTKTGVDRPISATETAKGTLNTDTLATQVSGSQISENPLLTETMISETDISNWEKILNVQYAWRCSSEVFPQGINPANDVDFAYEQYINHTSKWQITPYLFFTIDNAEPGSAYFLLEIGITNIVDGNEWIRIDNKMDVSVAVQEIPLDHVNAVMIPNNCGGGAGKYRVFSEGELDSSYKTFSLSPTYAEADYLTLQPGEFEYLQWFIRCNSPGIYKLKINVPYAHMGGTGYVEIEDLPTLICPNSISEWGWFNGLTLEDLTYDGDYTWNGIGYSVNSP